MDTASVTQTLDASTYQVDVTTEPARICPVFGQFWPWPLPQMANVLITFVAGFGSPDKVPPAIKVAIKMIVAHWYENREAVGMGSYAEVPLAARNLLSAWEIGEYV